MNMDIDSRLANGGYRTVFTGSIPGVTDLPNTTNNAVSGSRPVPACACPGDTHQPGCGFKGSFGEPISKGRRRSTYGCQCLGLQRHETGCLYSGFEYGRYPELSPLPPKAFERRKVDHVWLKRIGYDLLRAIGEDPGRPGLRATPDRFARMWRDFIEFDEGNVETIFDTKSTNELVMVGPIKVWSKCEHHLVDFWTNISIAVKPNKTILGLSKFARLAQKHAHRLQVQEQLISDIAIELRSILSTDDVAVYGRGDHLCISSRGIRSDGALSTNYSLSGAFLTGNLRHEFLELVHD